MGSHYLVQPETIPARYTPQGRAETPEALRGRIQLATQPPHHGTNHAAQANPCLSGNPNHHLQTTCRHAGAKLIFIYTYFDFLSTNPALRPKFLYCSIQIFSELSVTRSNVRGLSGDVERKLAALHESTRWVADACLPL